MGLGWVNSVGGGYVAVQLGGRRRPANVVSYGDCGNVALMSFQAAEARAPIPRDEAISFRSTLLPVTFMCLQTYDAQFRGP